MSCSRSTTWPASGQFFSTQTFWDVPPDPTGGNNEAGGAAPNQPPYYVLAQAPGQTQPTFQLTSAMTLLNRQFLAAWVSVSSDPKDYGQFRVLRLPTEDQPKGPVQVQNEFETTDQVTENRTLFNNPNVNVRYGNLLTLPVGGRAAVRRADLHRAEGRERVPAARQGARVLRRRVGFEPTLQGALEEVFGPGAGGEATPPDTGDDQPPGTSTPPGTTTPPPNPNPGENPALDKAVQDIGSGAGAAEDGAGSPVTSRRRVTALAALEKAAAAYETAKGTPPSTGGG